MKKGAFTGALGRHAGCFEQAHQGTLLLDEIGDMPLAMQAKLLRVLEESKLRRLGGNSEIPIKVQMLGGSVLPAERISHRPAAPASSQRGNSKSGGRDHPRSQL